MGKSVVGLTVRFVGGGPSEEAVRHAHERIGRMRLNTPPSLVIHWSDNGASARVKEARLVLDNGVAVSEGDINVLHAISQVCERAAALKPSILDLLSDWRAHA